MASFIPSSVLLIWLPFIKALVVFLKANAQTDAAAAHADEDYDSGEEEERYVALGNWDLVWLYFFS